MLIVQHARYIYYPLLIFAINVQFRRFHMYKLHFCTLINSDDKAAKTQEAHTRYPFVRVMSALVITVLFDRVLLNICIPSQYHAATFPLC